MNLEIKRSLATPHQDTSMACELAGGGKALMPVYLFRVWVSVIFGRMVRYLYLDIALMKDGMPIKWIIGHPKIRMHFTHVRRTIFSKLQMSDVISLLKRNICSICPIYALKT